MLITEFKSQRHIVQKRWQSKIIWWQNPSRLRSETAVPIDTILIKLNIIFSLHLNHKRSEGNEQVWFHSIGVECRNEDDDDDNDDGEADDDNVDDRNPTSIQILNRFITAQSDVYLYYSDFYSVFSPDFSLNTISIQSVWIYYQISLFANSSWALRLNSEWNYSWVLRKF